MSIPLFRRASTSMVVGVVLVAMTGAACSSGSSTTSSSLAVTATDTSCELDEKTFKAGELSIEVMNEGDKVTEVYVYGADDRVMGEVENIGPDTSRDFTVKLGAGSYEVACKPGQTGDGVRASIKVTGKADEQSADRSVSFESVEYAFEELDGFSVKAGETIEFRMHNEGSDEHEFEVLDADGSRVGEIGPTGSDETGVATMSFDKPGTYKYICDLNDHRSRGMEGSFIVK